MMSLVESLIRTIAFFDEIKKEGVIKDYALIGGLALSAWIRPRATKDIDLAVMVSENRKWSDIISLIEARLSKRVAADKGTRRTTIKEKLSFVSGQIEVDLISTKGFTLAAEAVRNAVATEVFGKQVKVATPEYLVLLKLIPLGGQDIVDIRALVKKTDRVRLKALAEKYYLSAKLESVIAP